MTEQQLRDVLARVVPEPPDSVADAAPVARVARRRRRTRVAGISALAAVLVAGTAVGVMALTADDSPIPAVVDEPKIPNPYTTASCPDPQQPWEAAPLADLSAVTAVRFCARDLNGFDAADGPRDALVVDLGSFTNALEAIAPADPARCAAVDVVPTDNRLLFQLADGSVVGVPAAFCQDAEIGGRSLDGDDVTRAFLGALRAQRDDQPYTDPGPEPATCVGFSDISPAQPGHERLVTGTSCAVDHERPIGLSDSQLATLQDAWDSATEVGDDELNAICSPIAEPPLLLVRTGHGDNVQVDATCGQLVFYAWDRTAYLLDLTAEDLLG